MTAVELIDEIEWMLTDIRDDADRVLQRRSLSPALSTDALKALGMVADSIDNLLFEIKMWRRVGGRGS